MIKLFLFQWIYKSRLIKWSYLKINIYKRIKKQRLETLEFKGTSITQTI